MTATLSDVVKHSGDSLLQAYSYANGQLTVTLVLGENEQQVSLTLPTDHVAFAGNYLAKKEDVYRTCRIVIEDLAQVLAVANGVYVPAPGFGPFMQQARASYALAYGKKVSEWKYFFSLVGYGRLVSCLLVELEAITIAHLTG